MSISAFTTRKPVSKVLAKKADEIIDHIIATIRPNQIFLIGSMHRGEVHDDSDLDLVAVVEDSSSRQELLMKVLPTRPHFCVPLDLHLVKQSEFDKLKDKGGICFDAQHHGRLLHRIEGK